VLTEAAILGKSPSHLAGPGCRLVIEATFTP